MKRVVKQADPWRFFWFISVNGKHINETVRAENVEFSIKVDSKAYSEEESDLRGFQGDEGPFPAQSALPVRGRAGKCPRAGRATDTRIGA